MILIEKPIRINQALILFFQPDSDFLLNSPQAARRQVSVPGESVDLFCFPGSGPGLTPH
jgi:hypothetical protein